MQSLIAMGRLDVVEAPAGPFLTFVRVVKEETLHKDEAPVLPPLPNIDDPNPPVEPSATPANTAGVKIPRPTGPETEAVAGFGPGLNDGPLVAMVRVEPSYPGKAAQEGQEGWVIVEFDVNPDGSVSNVRVVSSSHRVFERSAIRAAERFRYKARVVAGVAQRSRGIQNKFTFRMERG
jgi:protein TonB